jgi:hypothetical protein
MFNFYNLILTVMIKKLSFSLMFLIVILGAVQRSFASANSDLFVFDESTIESKFAPLQDLEQVLIDNPEADLNFVTVNYADALAKVSFAEATALPSLPTAPMEDRPALGIPGWIWGACLLGVGILAVYLILDDASQEYRKKQTVQAVIGCVGGAVLWIAVPFVLGYGAIWLI